MRLSHIGFVLLASQAFVGCDTPKESDSTTEAERCVTLAACGCEVSPCAVATPAITAAETVVPSDAFPSQVTSQTAHNNLDVIWFNDRLFFVFRTAPNHYVVTGVCSAETPTIL